MIFITDETEFKINGITALYFYADWLHFHKKMKIMINKIETEKQGIKFYAIDIDNFKNFVVRFKIDSIPTVIVFNETGKELKRIVGMTMTSAFRGIFNDIYSNIDSKKEK